jgi:DUF1365 family protein
MKSLLNFPSIHFGRVIHQRSTPKNHFNYPVFYLRIPMRTRRLDPHLLKRHGIGDNRFSWISFFDKDHGVREEDSLAWVEKIIHQSDLPPIDGEIWLHTFPRVLGYVFNPVSFWFCHNASDQLTAIIAEVNNTFGERHSYVLKPANQDEIIWGVNLSAEKVFHVSPFFNVEGNYLFRFMRQSNNSSAPRQVSRIEYFEKGVRVLMTSVSGTEFPLDWKSKCKAIASFPFLTFGVITKIHWQALKLWLKGAHFYKKPKPPSIQIT